MPATPQYVRLVVQSVKTCVWPSHKTNRSEFGKHINCSNNMNAPPQECAAPHYSPVSSPYQVSSLHICDRYRFFSPVRRGRNCHVQRPSASQSPLVRFCSILCESMATLTESSGLSRVSLLVYHLSTLASCPSPLVSRLVPRLSVRSPSFSLSFPSATSTCHSQDIIHVHK